MSNPEQLSTLRLGVAMAIVAGGSAGIVGGAAEGYAIPTHADQVAQAEQCAEQLYPQQVTAWEIPEPCDPFRSEFPKVNVDNDEAYLLFSSTEFARQVNFVSDAERQASILATATFTGLVAAGSLMVLFTLPNERRPRRQPAQAPRGK